MSSGWPNLAAPEASLPPPRPGAAGWRGRLGKPNDVAGLERDTENSAKLVTFLNILKRLWSVPGPASRGRSRASGMRDREGSQAQEPEHSCPERPRRPLDQTLPKLQGELSSGLQGEMPDRADR